MTPNEIEQAVADLPSFITGGDIDCYHKYASLINRGVIVDLGTGWGKSMIALALANPDNQLITCDPGNYPIYQGWAKDQVEYEYKIRQLIAKFNLQSQVQFFPLSAEEIFDKIIDEIDILHIDNWLEINQTDTSRFLEQWIGKIKKGGYFLARNYGHGDRQPYTDSVDKATKGLKKIEQLGLIGVFQK